MAEVEAAPWPTCTCATWVRGGGCASSVLEMNSALNSALGVFGRSLAPFMPLVGWTSLGHALEAGRLLTLA